ncbi:MAG: sigma-54-dependent Fis family transcriptional regulator [Nitrospinae bacterium]|nr:sigma-54-dependent Fis family transcriptional regulator [Nitrospinota bacterium]
MDSRILVVDDEESIRFTFENFLSEEGYKVFTARNYNEAVSMLSQEEFDLVFADIILEDMTGVDILRQVKEKKLNCPVIMITGEPNIETASDALRLGAFDYIPKPVRQDTLLRVAKNALQHKSLINEKERYRQNLEAIFKSVKDAIITVDKELTVIELNESADSICELSRSSIGKRFDSLPKLCSGECLNALQETIKRNEPIEVYRFNCQHKGRPNQVVTLNTYPLLYDKNVFSGVILVVKDETRIVSLEEDLKACSYIDYQKYHNIIGKSYEMQKIYSLVESLKDVTSTVLITGESGTGKELIAEAIHYMGIRSYKPLIKVNCSALPEELLESELFGHVKGAFTGAVRDKEGRFKKAEGGTIFLDEIGDISPKIQLKLLRVIQEKVFERVGDSTPINVDVRVVAATNKDIKEKIRRGEFREDLYYRLKVVEIKLPSLRERREDIPLLVNHFLDKLNKKLNKNIKNISADVNELFINYPWHGNIRELEHTLEHAFILCQQDVITVEHLPSEFKDFIKIKPLSIKESGDNEYDTIFTALEKSAWNKAKAARLLGISRRTIYRKMVEYKIEKKDV